MLHIRKTKTDERLAVETFCIEHACSGTTSSLVFLTSSEPVLIFCDRLVGGSVALGNAALVFGFALG